MFSLEKKLPQNMSFAHGYISVVVYIWFDVGP